MNKHDKVRQWLSENRLFVLSELIILALAAYWFIPLGDPDGGRLEEIERQANHAYIKGDFHQAETLCREFLAEAREEYGFRHPLVATALNNLGLVYQAEGKPEQALPILKYALEINETFLGSRHMDVAASQTNLALLHEAMHNYDDALTLYEKALTTTEILQNHDHPYLAFIKYKVARLNKEKQAVWSRKLVTGIRRTKGETPEINAIRVAI